MLLRDLQIRLIRFLQEFCVKRFRRIDVLLEDAVLDRSLVFLRGSGLGFLQRGLQRVLVTDDAFVVRLEFVFQQPAAGRNLVADRGHLLVDFGHLWILRPVGDAQLRRHRCKLAQFPLELGRLHVGECFRNLGDAALAHLLVQGLFQDAIRFRPCGQIVQARELFRDQRGFAFGGVNVVVLRVVGQRLFGALDFGFQFARRTIEPFGSAREFFHFSVEAGLDEAFGDRVGHIGSDHRIDVRECDRHRTGVDDGPDPQRTLHHSDVRRQAINLFGRALSLDLGLHGCGREHRGRRGIVVALDFAGNVMQRRPEHPVEVLLAGATQVTVFGAETPITANC